MVPCSISLEWDLALALDRALARAASVGADRGPAAAGSPSSSVAREPHRGSDLATRPAVDRVPVLGPASAAGRAADWACHRLE